MSAIYLKNKNYNTFNFNVNLPPFVYAEMNQVARLILSAFLNLIIIYNWKHLLDNDIGVPNG